MNTPLRVVVVDDSPFICRLLTNYLQTAPDVQVVGIALNGERAVELIKDLHPDVVTLDLEMPKMGGLEALGLIMQTCPTPVVMISGVSSQAASVTLQALELGAVDFVLKYTPGVDTDPETLRLEIITKVRTAARVKVIRSLRPRQPGAEAAYPHLEPLLKVQSVLPTPTLPTNIAPLLPGGVVVIGASTGGPVALRELLEKLPANFKPAVLVVQHIPAAFTKVLAAQLDRHVAIKVRQAEAGDQLQPGLALVAPGGYHMLVRPDSRIELSQGPEIRGHRPSIDVTMQSAAQVYGSRTTGVVLSGMGDDGSLGMVAIWAKGGKTFAQDAESCVVNGMPQRAIDKGVVKWVASPAKIAHLLAA